jgi:hypothetical protein
VAGEINIMSIKESLIEQIRRFDDEAFTALASKGLLRRAQKDLEKNKATIVDESDLYLTIDFMGYQIRFDQNGPAYASCSCKSGGVCQHIIAAAISLQKDNNQGETIALENDNKKKVSLPQNVPDNNVEILQDGTDQFNADLLHSEIMNVTFKELLSYSGKSGYRYAWQYSQDLDLQRDLKICGDKYIIIDLAHPRISFRYMGGGLDNLISDIQPGKIKQLRVAAILAYHKANNKEIMALEENPNARIVELNLGKDFAGTVDQDVAEEDSRSRLRSSTRLIITEVIQLGLSHVTSGYYERFSTLAIWAQGAKYYRLALLLRRLADHVDMLLERSAAADEYRMFDELTIAFALVNALDNAAKQNSAPANLIGKARAAYEKTSSLELYCLGAQAWRAASGYLGLTLLFWSPKDESFFSYTDARPENMQRGFNPINRHAAPGPWIGLKSPASANGRRIVLTNASVSDLGRISGSDSISASVFGYFTKKDFAEKAQIYSKWDDVLTGRREGRLSLLSEPDPMKDWVILEPKYFGKPQFESVKQVLVWPLYDTEEQMISAELIYSEYTNHAINRIEKIHSDEIAAGTLIIGRLRNGTSGIVIEPLSLIYPDSVFSENVIDNVHFDKDTSSFASKWIKRIQNFGINKNTTSEDKSAIFTIPAVLIELGQILRKRAERGVNIETVNIVNQEIDMQCKKMINAGFPVFGAIHSEKIPAPAKFLQANYLRLQFERLMDNSEGTSV